jgi:MFS transporter, putative metabolite:H+ symporter
VIFVRAGVVGVVAMLAALLLIQAIAVAFFGIETRQKPLEALRPETAGPSAMAIDSAVQRSPRA